MRCEDVRAALSAIADGAPAADVTTHVAACPTCTAFEAGIRSLRSALRFEVLDDAPDVAPAVLARVGTPARRRRLPWVAALVAGLVAGASFAWPSGGRGDVAVAALPAQVVAAQADLRTFRASLTVIERGPGRRRSGSIAYRAPERLLLQLGDARLAIEEGRIETDAPGTGPVVRDGLEPFPDDALAPLDLVLPADAFTAAATPEALGTDVIDGHRAVGVRVPAAQVAAILQALRPGGEGREVNPADVVDLWLEREHLVPLRMVVRAGDGPDRHRWAAARGLSDADGAVILEARLTDVEVNGPVSLPAGSAALAPGASVAPVPSWLPTGMRPYRSGTTADVGVRTWTDGRAWVKVRATRTWPGGRLFGDVGAAVRPVVSGDGVAYVAEDGSQVAVHGDGIDLVVSGSVPPAALRRVAASFGVTGLRVPDGWAEAATVTLGEARRAVPGLLLLPPVAGFGVPAARSDGSTVVLVYAGAGARAVTIATRQGQALTPPLDADATGVLVRGRPARWSPSRGELEWVEAGRLWSVRSTTIGLVELVHLADSLRVP